MLTLNIGKAITEMVDQNALYKIHKAYDESSYSMMYVTLLFFKMVTGLVEITFLGTTVLNFVK